MTVYTVTVAPEGRTFRCPDTKSILVGVEHSGGADTIQVGCRSGGCGVCRVEVLDGTYTAKRMSKAFCTDDDVARTVDRATREVKHGSRKSPDVSDADALAVQHVHEVHEVLGGAVARAGRESNLELAKRTLR